MPFQNEREFETHIRHLITKLILPLDENLVLIRNKKAVNVDLQKWQKARSIFH